MKAGILYKNNVCCTLRWNVIGDNQCCQLGGKLVIQAKRNVHLISKPTSMSHTLYKGEEIGIKRQCYERDYSGHVYTSNHYCRCPLLKRSEVFSDNIYLNTASMNIAPINSANEREYPILQSIVAILCEVLTSVSPSSSLSKTLHLL